MKYISQPPLLLNVHMHNPTVSIRSWMDSLLAFFPGLQVQQQPWVEGDGQCCVVWGSDR